MTVTVPFGWANRVALAKLRPHMDMIISQPVAFGENYPVNLVSDMVLLLTLATQALDRLQPEALGVKLDVDEATAAALRSRRQHLKALLATGAKQMMHDWLPLWGWLLEVHDRVRGDDA